MGTLPLSYRKWVPRNIRPLNSLRIPYYPLESFVKREAIEQLTEPEMEVSRSWASLRGVVLCQFDDFEVLYLAGFEGEAHEGAMDLRAEGAGCTRIEQEGGEMAVEHGTADVAVSAHE